MQPETPKLRTSMRQSEASSKGARPPAISEVWDFGGWRAALRSESRFRLPIPGIALEPARARARKSISVLRLSSGAGAT